MPGTIAGKLKTISLRTIDRLLHRAIPIVTWFDYARNPPGFFQIDRVQHDGGNPAGEFCYTLTMTDVKTSWTDHRLFPLPGGRRRRRAPSGL